MVRIHNTCGCPWATLACDILGGGDRKVWGIVGTVAGMASGVVVVATGAARFFSAGCAIVHQVDRHSSRGCTDDAYS
jgi:hypothetical protein